MILALIATLAIQDPEAPKWDQTPWDKPIFGISVAEINNQSRKQLKKSLTEQFEDQIRPGFRADMAIGKDGLIITEVSSLLDTQFQKNDIIKEADGTQITNEKEFAKFVSESTSGKEYTFQILRPSLIRNRTVYQPQEIKTAPTSKLLMVLGIYDTQKDKANRLTHYSLKLSKKRPMYIYVTATEDGEIYQRVVFQTIHGDYEGLRNVTLVSGEKRLSINRTDSERQDSNIIGAFSREWIDRRETALPGVLDFFQENEEVIMVFTGMDSWRKDHMIAGDIRDNIELNKKLIQALEQQKK